MMEDIWNVGISQLWVMEDTWRVHVIYLECSGDRGGRVAIDWKTTLDYPGCLGDYPGARGSKVHSSGYSHHSHAVIVPPSH